MTYPYGASIHREHKSCFGYEVRAASSIPAGQAQKWEVGESLCEDALRRPHEVLPETPSASTISQLNISILKSFSWEGSHSLPVLKNPC